MLDSREPNRAEQIAGAAQAAQWLRAHALDGDLVASVVPVTPWLPALSGLNAYASTPMTVGLWLREGAAAEFERRQTLVDRYASDGDPAARQELCNEGVRWVWWGGEDPATAAGTVTRFGPVSLERLC